MTHLARIAALIYGRPLLVHPATAETIHTALGARFGMSEADALLPEASRFRGAPTKVNDVAHYRNDGGVAIITVTGELVNRGAWIGAASGLTSYEGIAAQLRCAAADPSVSAIVLDLNTPGGEAVGAFEAAARVKEAAAKKPVVAFVDGMAASAGYALASGADRIVVTPSAIVGSIGVVMLHLDQSRRLDKAGVTPTFIFAGKHKVDGHSFGPLPDSVRGDLQAEVEQFYDLFVTTVARNRGADPDAIRDTEARCFMGAEAVAAGLADGVGTLDDVLASLQSPGSSPGFSGAYRMDSISKADHDAAVAKATTDGFAAGTSAGAKGERERIGAILGHAEADGRSALARHLAFESNHTADVAAGILKHAAKDAPAALAPAPAPGRMSHVPEPAVQPDAPEPDGKATSASAWGAVMDQVNKEALAGRR